MTFIFWQNINSIHQKAFLVALAKQPGVGKVLLIVAEELTDARKDMGWDIPSLESVEIIMSPSADEIKHIVGAHKDAVHIMGGIRIGRMMTAAFDECIRHKCRVGIMTEPYNNAGFKGRLRAVKYQYYGAKYFRYIQFVLAIGKQGVKQYSDLGYNAKRLFPWAYFITLGQQGRHPTTGDTSTVRIIYAGRLEEGKGMYPFLNELANSGKKNFKLDIYGTGPNEEKIRNLILEHGLSGNVSVTPFIKNEELLAKYAQYDWVVLPSTQKDGWGVIVSEGLLSGLKAVCSSICGVSWVIKEGFNGVEFDWADKDSCSKAIGKMLSGSGFADREAISAWANKTISGEAGATYFMQIINCIYNDKERPGVPWLQD